MNIEFLKELKKVYSIAMPYDKNGHVNKNIGGDLKTFQKYYNMEKGKYHQYFDELIAIIQDLNALEVLAYFSFQRAILSRHNVEDDSLNIFQIQILQYIMLCSKDAKKYRALDCNLIEMIKDYLLAIPLLESGIKNNGNKFESIQRKIREDTAYLRINYVVDFDREINKSLFKLIDKSINYELGVKISLIIDMFFIIIRQMNRKILDYIDNISICKTGNIDLNYVRSIMTYSLEDFVKAYGEDVKKDSIKVILDKLSFTLNEDLSIDYDSMFFKNPVLNRFLIIDNYGKYFFPVTESFFGRIKEISEYLIGDKQLLMEKYNKCKGSFLENEILKLFKSKFTDCKIFTNSYWKSSDDGKMYENDMLIIYKNYAIIIEAKGNNISNYTREGNINNAKKDMAKLILKSAKQANGFKKFLMENKEKQISLKKKNSTNNDISLLNINQYICLSVSIDGMQSLGNSQLQWFQELNGHKKDIIIPHIQLGHLMVIFDILDMEVEVIHYLRQRTIIDRSLKYTADELDLLGMYLKSGLNLNFHNKEHVAPFMGLSKEIDEYYSHKLSKPKCKRTKLFMDGIEKFERLSNDSIDEEILFLDISYKGQQGIEKQIKYFKDKMINEKAVAPIITQIIGDDCRCIVGVLYWECYTAEQVKLAVRKNKFYHILKGKRDEIYILGIELDYHNNYSCGFIDKINLKNL